MWLRHVLRARVRANISNKNAQRQRKSWRNQCTRGQRLETPDKRCYPGNLICKALSGAASLLPQWGQTYLSMVGSMGARTPPHRCMLSQPVKHKRGIGGQNAPTPRMISETTSRRSFCKATSCQTEPPLAAIVANSCVARFQGAVQIFLRRTNS